MKTSYHILVVEDDPVGRQTLAAYLVKDNHRVSEAGDGEQMRAIFAKGDVDVILLDINLPGEDGLSLLRELRRQSEVGVIMVTSRREDVDRIVALELGADDYVTKPYNMREILPRTRNLARRVTAARVVKADESKKSFEGWTLDIAHWTLTDPSGEAVKMTRAEFELLATFVTHPGQVLSRDQLMTHVSRRGHESFDRTIDVLVRRVRRKIEPDPAKPRLIVTVHGLGYVFSA
ncbi:two-component system response regulator DorR [Rhodobacter capsulatus]|uniref:two-component system response regulator DorR n=1 Tax=Rhodobacter capsulatus TaxID=1061 RepID=UPI0040280E7D